MLKLELITKENVDFATEVFHKIFSWLESTDPFRPALEGEGLEYAKAIGSKLYMVYDDETLVGLTGFYYIPPYTDSAFLGWFGVVPEQRRNHYGSKILELHEKTLKEAGYKYSRLYTETQNNDATRRFYERCGYVGEDYYNPEEDPLIPEHAVTVYSKSLGDYPIEPWNSRNMNLGKSEQAAMGIEDEEELKKVFAETMNKKHE